MTEYLIFPRKTLQTAFGEKWINRSGLADITVVSDCLNYFYILSS